MNHTFRNVALSLNKHLVNGASGHREKGIKENFMMMLRHIVKFQAAG